MRKAGHEVRHKAGRELPRTTLHRAGPAARRSDAQSWARDQARGRARSFPNNPTPGWPSVASLVPPPLVSFRALLGRRELLSRLEQGPEARLVPSAGSRHRSTALPMSGTASPKLRGPGRHEAGHKTRHEAGRKVGRGASRADIIAPGPRSPPPPPGPEPDSQSEPSPSGATPRVAGARGQRPGAWTKLENFMKFVV